MNSIYLDRGQMVLVNHGGRTHRTGWALIYPDGTSPGLLRARLRERRGLHHLAGLNCAAALAPVRIYAPAGGWPTWGIEFTGTPVPLADEEPLPMPVSRFCALTGWSPPETTA